MRDTDASTKGEGSDGPRPLLPLFVRHSIACYLVVIFVWFSSLFPLTPAHVLKVAKEINASMVFGFFLAPLLLPIVLVCMVIMAIDSRSLGNWRLWVAVVIYFVALYAQRILRRFDRTAR